MSALKVGIAGAALIAGPPLYSLVETGMMDSSAALARGAIVAVVCTFGAIYVQRMIEGYEHEWQQLQRVQGQEEPPAEEGPAGAFPGDPRARTPQRPGG